MPATNETRTFPARADSLVHLHAMLDRFWGALELEGVGVVPSHVRYGLSTAMGEVAANIIRYAHTPSFAFSLTLRPGNRVEARFDDTGVPFRGVPDGDFNPDMLSEGGMGLALAKRALDVLDYERLPDETNRWTLVLQLPEPA